MTIKEFMLKYDLTKSQVISGCYENRFKYETIKLVSHTKGGARRALEIPDNDHNRATVERLKKKNYRLKSKEVKLTETERTKRSIMNIELDSEIPIVDATPDDPNIETTKCIRHNGYINDYCWTYRDDAMGKECRMALTHTRDDPETRRD